MTDRDGNTLTKGQRVQVVRSESGTHDLLGKVGKVDQPMTDNCWVQFKGAGVCMDPKHLRLTSHPLSVDAVRGVTPAGHRVAERLAK